jgi:hypothetical protein
MAGLGRLAPAVPPSEPRSPGTDLRALPLRSATPADAKPLVDIVPRFRRSAGVAWRRRGDIGSPRLAMADWGRQRAGPDRPWGLGRRLVVRRVLRPGRPGDGGQDRERRHPCPRLMSLQRTRQDPLRKPEQALHRGHHSCATARSPSITDSPGTAGTAQQHSRVAAALSARWLHRIGLPALPKIDPARYH